MDSFVALLVRFAQRAAGQVRTSCHHHVTCRMSVRCPPTSSALLLSSAHDDDDDDGDEEPIIIDHHPLVTPLLTSVSNNKRLRRHENRERVFITHWKPRIYLKLANRGWLYRQRRKQNVEVLATSLVSNTAHFLRSLRVFPHWSSSTGHIGECCS